MYICNRYIDKEIDTYVNITIYAYVYVEMHEPADPSSSALDDILNSRCFTEKYIELFINPKVKIVNPYPHT